jgi:hypothetical protein
MSVFTPEEARRLAALTFRRSDKFSSASKQLEAGKAKQKLLGLENELLTVLRAAEQRYEDCRQEIDCISKLRRSDRYLPQFCADLARRLKAVKESLAKLDPISREELDSVARYQDSSTEEMHERIDVLLAWLQDAAHSPLDDEHARISAANKAQPGVRVVARRKGGRKLGIGNSRVVRLPFEEFAKEIRNFLISPGVGIEFSFDDKTRDDLDPVIREPVSEAARLLYEAARLLDSRVEVADIDKVIEAVNENPEFRDELLDDKMVKVLTG